MLPPIPTDNFDAGDVERLTRYTRDLMLKAVLKLTESARGQQAFRASPGPLEIGMPVESVPVESTSVGTKMQEQAQEKVD